MSEPTVSEVLVYDFKFDAEQTYTISIRAKSKKEAVEILKRQLTLVLAEADKIPVEN